MSSNEFGHEPQHPTPYGPPQEAPYPTPYGAPSELPNQAPYGYSYGQPQQPPQPWGPQSAYQPFQSAQPAAPSNNRRTALIAGGAVGAVVLVAATVGITLAVSGHNGSAPTAAPITTSASSSASPAVVVPTTVSVAVEYTLYDRTTYNNGCIGRGGYSDISVGQPVTLTDGSGTTLGASSLPPAVPAAPDMCVFRLSMDGVPKDKPFYAVSIGRRGTVTEPAAQLQANLWVFTLNLGNPGD